MYYAIQHVTQFHYSQPIRESVMEVYMKPRTEGFQRCLRFQMLTKPHAHTFEQDDFLGNTLQFFDIPTQHNHLAITTESVVELTMPPALPDALGSDAWEILDQKTQSSGEFWDMLMPSDRTESSALLEQFMSEIDLRRRDDPLRLLNEINAKVYQAFDYTPNSTDVDSPINVALESRLGVCQDFAHVMLALVRNLGIPCRYVSGYLYNNRTDRSVPDATHAWVEAYLPQTGWIGFDPTNNVQTGERHIRVAIGRDYNDVPPTRGIFKGVASTELGVAVHVTPTEAPYAPEHMQPSAEWEDDDLEHQSQQQ